MVDKTVEQLLIGIESSIYQVGGVATQVYAQDNLVKKIEDSFFILATDPEKKWKRFRTYEVYTLDGTTGRATTDIIDTFASYDHILAVYPENSDRQLVVDNLNRNPSLNTGNYPLAFVPDSTDVLKVIPKTATGNITVVGLSLPAVPFRLDTVVPFDSIAIEAFVAWQYMSDDGANPQAAERLRQIFDTRYSHLWKMQEQSPIAINGRGSTDYPREWSW